MRESSNRFSDSTQVESIEREEKEEKKIRARQRREDEGLIKKKMTVGFFDRESMFQLSYQEGESRGIASYPYSADLAVFAEDRFKLFSCDIRLETSCCCC